MGQMTQPTVSEHWR